MQIILTYKPIDGRWFGRIKNSDDGHGNEIDCYLYTPKQVLASLLEQHKESLTKTIKDDRS